MKKKKAPTVHRSTISAKSAKRPPDYNVFVAIDGGEDWQPIGAAWKHSDGKGLSVKVQDRTYFVRERYR